MPYATPTQLIDWYGADELARRATPARYPVVADELLIATVNGDDRSAWSAEEQAAADAALSLIEQALADAGRTVDSYVGARRVVPLADAVVANTPIPRHCGAIARHLLHDDQRLEDGDPVRVGHDQALRWLRDFSAGRVALGDESDAPTGAGPVLTSGPPARFGRDKGLL